MAFNPAPSEWIASWSEDGTDITIPIASLPELTAGEADGSEGDIRKVLYALLHELHAVYAGLATADRPTKMVISRNIGAIQDNVQQVTFQVSFQIEYTGADVADES